jgi:peptidoglycan hydrolase-like protein with peptidoglycan-binding domain
MLQFAGNGIAAGAHRSDLGEGNKLGRTYHMQDLPEEDVPRLRRRDALALVVAASLSALVLYNTVWGQKPGIQLARTDIQPALNGTTKLVVNAGDSGTSSITVRFDPVIEDIQRALAKSGYYAFAIDGVNGKRTRDAISAYQQANGLDITGEASAALVDHIKFTQTIIEAAGPIAETKNEAGPDKIIQAQTGLSELGYLQGPPNGTMGIDTREAIRNFERDRGLPETGEVSSALLTELGKTSGITQLLSQ